MKYQLVLQWPTRDNSDFDTLIAYEDILLKRLPSRLAEVDGHDIGSGEMNIFIFTDFPQKALDSCRALIRSEHLMTSLSAGYREATKDDYLRLWPADSTSPFMIK